MEDLDEETGENKITMMKIINSTLFGKVLKDPQNFALFDENVLLSLTQLVAKVALKEKQSCNGEWIEQAKLLF